MMVDPKEQEAMNRMMAAQLEQEPDRHEADKEADRYERWRDKIGEGDG